MKMIFKFLFLILLQTASTSSIFGGYFPNWAQYREKPYAFVPSDLDYIAEKLNYLVYSNIHFKIEDFSLLPTDKSDYQYLSQLSSYRDSLPKFKVLISIGGEEFPSESFSTMVRSNKTRAIFIANVKQFLNVYRLDGVEISWKWPCSPPKIIRKQHFRNCEDFIEVRDGGSRCPQDAFNFLNLLKELRYSLGTDATITLSGSPFPEVIKMTPLALYSRYVNHWHVETFGYADAATNYSYLTAPYSPLYCTYNSPDRHCINDTGTKYY